MVQQGRGAVCIVDVCHTLVSEDTTIGLLAWYFSHRPDRRWRLAALRLLTARASPLRIGVVALERLARRPVAKFLLVRMLSGDSMSALRRSGTEYAGHLLRGCKVNAVWDIVSPALDHDQVVLASASLAPVVGAIAEAIGAKYVASTLKVNGDVLTGRYERDLSGKKVEALRALFGGDIPKGCTVITDNEADGSLLALAHARYVVLRKRRDRRHWRGTNAIFVDGH